MMRRLLMLAALLGLATTVSAQSLKVGQAWARPTAPGQSTGGGFLVIENTSGARDRLMGARSDVASSVELHQMSMDGSVMRMRRIDAIEVPAGATVELKPGGLHLMLVGLKAPLEAGRSIDLVLSFEKAGEVRVPMSVAAHAKPHLRDVK